MDRCRRPAARSALVAGCRPFQGRRRQHEHAAGRGRDGNGRSLRAARGGEVARQQRPDSREQRAGRERTLHRLRDAAELARTRAAGAEEERLDSRHGRLEPVRDLAVRQPLHLAQEQGLAQARRHAGEHAGQGLDGLVLLVLGGRDELLEQERIPGRLELSPARVRAEPGQADVSAIL
jgi:hypothetical protein